DKVVGWAESRGWGIPARAFLVCLLAAIVLWQIYLFTSLLKFVDRNDTRGGFNVPAKYHIRAAKAVKRLSQNARVIVLSQGDNPDWDEIPGIYDFLLRPGINPRFVDYQEALIFPLTDALYLLAPDDPPALSFLDEYAQELKAERIPICGGPDTLRFYRFDEETLPAIKASLTGEGMPIALDNGAEILGYELEENIEPGDTLPLVLYWTVQARPSARYHFFNHLVDDNERMWGQKDGPGYPPGPWHEGDVVISWFDIAIPLDVPPGRYWVLTGMYTYPEMIRASVLDEQGQPVSDALHLGPIEIGH
ncbi:MAG: hypothetical protein U9R11_02645, partial [Chloroflexota bacterium]|nr:hypothetical protein [Chloroflexota bacterium]